MKWIWRACMVGALGSLLVVTAAVARDIDQDGRDELTGDLVPATSPGNPMADGPIHSIYLGGLGITGNINAATWESDGMTSAPNGATGYLWVGDTGNNIVYKIDATVPMIVATLYLGVNLDGLGWDGQYLIVHDSGGLVHQVDPTTGAVVASVPSVCGWPHGISWKADNSPWSDQWMWEPDFSGGMVHQVQYFTNTIGFSFMDGGSVIGSLTDGWRTWTSDFGTDNYYQYDIATGALLNSLYVGAVNGNPRDGTWDGHHLWDVTWWNGNWAWQWDLYTELSMYEVTICPNPKYTAVQRGQVLTLMIGIKNHTASPQTVKGTLEVYDCNGVLRVVEGPRTINMAPGMVINYAWHKTCPMGAPLGIYKVRTIIEDMNYNEIHEDWCVVEVIP
jgi:hypothetical protein